MYLWQFSNKKTFITKKIVCIHPGNIQLFLLQTTQKTIKNALQVELEGHSNISSASYKPALKVGQIIFCQRYLQRSGS